MGKPRLCAIGLTIMLMLVAGGAARAGDCPIGGQRPMLIIQLFFGQTIAGKGALPEKAWRRFLRDTVTPAFPDGFTVFGSYGQWRAPRAEKISRERSKVIEIAADDTADVAQKVADIAAIYRKRFHQQSVGIVTSSGCGAF